MTRREALAASLGAGLAWAHGRQRLDISRFSAITDEIARTPEDAIAFARQYGLRYIELRSVPGRRAAYEALPEDELRQASQQLKAAGLGVSFFDTGLLKFSLPGTEPVRARLESAEARQKRLARDGERFERRMEDLARALKAARILGAGMIRVFTFTRVVDPRALFPRIAGLLEPMIEPARRANVRLLVENEASCNVATSRELADLLSLLPSKWIALNWDPLNAISYGEVPFPNGYDELPKKRIANAQIKGRSILDYPQKMDWGAVIDTMLRDGYQGRFGLETHIFGAEQIERSHECLRAIQRMIAERKERAA